MFCLLFALGLKGYLKDPWNKLGGFVVITSWLAYIPALAPLNALSAIRSIRTLRALQAIKKLSFARGVLVMLPCFLLINPLDERFLCISISKWGKLVEGCFVGYMWPAFHMTVGVVAEAYAIDVGSHSCHLRMWMLDFGLHEFHSHFWHATFSQSSLLPVPNSIRKLQYQSFDQ